MRGERAEGRFERAEGRGPRAEGSIFESTVFENAPGASDPNLELICRVSRSIPRPSDLGPLPSAFSPRPTPPLPPGIRTWTDGRVLVEAQHRYSLIVIGCSMGGMHALEQIFGALPADFPVPIIVAQHRYRTSGDALPAFLRRHSKLSVVDATDKQWIHPGHVYLAPADYHLLVDRDGELSLSVDAAVAYSRPSIDVLFESAAEAYLNAVIGVVLTGANNDGARGVARIKQKGGFVVVQDPGTAESAEMPSAAIQAARVDRILPLERIGPFLVELCRNSG